MSAFVFPFLFLCVLPFPRSYMGCVLPFLFSCLLLFFRFLVHECFRVSVPFFVRASVPSFIHGLRASFYFFVLAFVLPFLSA